MKVTKFVHSCLLIETAGRAALFDPGKWSEQALDVSRLERLDDIFITHEHSDHFSPELIAKLLQRFPEARITSTRPVVAKLHELDIMATTDPPSGVTLFKAPHEDVEPMSLAPEQIGVHYLDVLSDPGDSHSFKESKAILALPVTAPWGSTLAALRLALQLKPKFVLPIHDWHWSDAARRQTYDQYEQILGKQGTTFFKLETAQPVDIAVEVKAAS